MQQSGRAGRGGQGRRAGQGRAGHAQGAGRGRGRGWGSLGLAWSPQVLEICSLEAPGPLGPFWGQNAPNNFRTSTGLEQMRHPPMEVGGLGLEFRVEG